MSAKIPWWVVRITPDVVGVGFDWVMAEYDQADNVVGSFFAYIEVR